MKTTNFDGIIPPVMTSFTEEGEIYEKGTRAIVDFVVPHVQGLYPCGTYGSGPMMSIHERMRAAEIIVDQVAGRIPVMVHVGTADTVTTVDLARHAETIGAQAVGAILPYYNEYSQEAIYIHYRRLMDAVKIPVYLYHNPKTAGYTVSNDTLVRLAREGLAGVKDSTFDLVNYYHMKIALRAFPEMNLIIGTEAILVAAFDAGAVGAVTGLGNVFPDLLEKLYLAYGSGDRTRTLELQEEVLVARQICKFGPTVPVMHAILRMRGVDGGYPRLPLTWIAPDLERKVKDAFEGIALL